jgi:hypothetical protein
VEESGANSLLITRFRVGGDVGGGCFTWPYEEQFGCRSGGPRGPHARLPRVRGLPRLPRSFGVFLGARFLFLRARFFFLGAHFFFLGAG